MYKQLIFDNVLEAIDKAIKADKLGSMKELCVDNLAPEKTKNPEFGDFAVNISPLARHAKIPPAQIALAISEFIKIEGCSVNTVQGFINIKIGEGFLNKAVCEILNKQNKFGSNTYGNNEKVILEYVSANPTGPLHIGHGRWAAMGSALANVLNFSGYNVWQEFYINDAGNQINNLARSLWIRVLQELGQEVTFPEGDEAKSYYPGEYLIETAQNYLSQNKQKAVEFFAKYNDAFAPSEEIITEMAEFAKKEMLNKQKTLLNQFGVHFDKFYSETALHQSGEVESCIAKLKELGKLYEKDDAIWFKSSDYGDDQDRVIKKTDGSNTYLTADIAYHYDKLKRGFTKLINIWGADHHGYVARMRASIEALGYNPDSLEVLLGQLVNLIISGEQVRMGKRKKMLTLEDLINEVGKDATRFWMIMRTIDTTLDFDVDLAKSSTDENPVFYVQYAHARACSILRNAVAERIDTENKQTLPPYIEAEELNKFVNVDFDANILKPLWVTDEESASAAKSLILKLESFKETVYNSAKSRAPYMLCRYAQDLAGEFHRFYSISRVLSDDKALMIARLALVVATKQVLSNSLELLGVSAPESM